MPWTYTFHRQAMLNRTTRILKPIAFRTRFHGETIKMLWLKRSCYDLKRSQRFHAKTSPLQWLKTKCYDLTLPLGLCSHGPADSSWRTVPRVWRSSSAASCVRSVPRSGIFEFCVGVSLSKQSVFAGFWVSMALVEVNVHDWSQLFMMTIIL